MSRTWILLGSLLALSAGALGADGPAIDADNWTEAVGFAPAACAPCAGTRKVTAANLDAFADHLPAGLQELIRKRGLNLELTGYQPVHPSEAYIQATDAHRGQARIKDIGEAYDERGIENYQGGLPFPQPGNGLEVAWNFHYAYGADDAELTYGVVWVNADNGVEHTEKWRLWMIRGTHRTDIEPLPHIASFQRRGLQGAGLTSALAPYDKKGFGAVYFKSVEPKDGQGHVYVPAMRRIIKNSFGTRGDTWNATDLFYEDVRGYSGYPEWMRWKILAKKTVLLPMHSGAKAGEKFTKKIFDFKNPPHWNPKYKWEPRPTFVLEVTPKLPDYPYSRQLLYVDAEAYQVLYKEAYDRKGELWKIMINAASQREDADSGETFLAWVGTLVIDVQADHATVFHVHKARGNVGLDPDMFSVSSLRKRSR